MSYSIIKEVYYGNRGVSENLKISKEYSKALERCVATYDKLKKTLNEEQRALLEEYFECTCDLESELAVNKYSEGYKVGLLTGVECMQD